MLSEYSKNIMMTKSSLDNFCRFAEEGPTFVNHKSLPGVTDMPSQIIITQVDAFRRRFPSGDENSTCSAPHCHRDPCAEKSHGLATGPVLRRSMGLPCAHIRPLPGFDTVFKGFPLTKCTTLLSKCGFHSLLWTILESLRYHFL